MDGPLQPPSTVNLRRINNVPITRATISVSAERSLPPIQITCEAHFDELAVLRARDVDRPPLLVPALKSEIGRTALDARPGSSAEGVCGLLAWGDAKCDLHLEVPHGLAVLGL